MTMPMDTKLGSVVTYSKLPPINSHDPFIKCFCKVCNKLNALYLHHEKAYDRYDHQTGKGDPPLKSQNSLNMRSMSSREKLNKLYLHYRNASNHKT